MESIEQTFNEKTYHLYLDGKITLKDMIKEFHSDNYELKKYFLKNNLLFRRDFLNKTTVHNFFETIDNSIKAYLLGFYFADGCITEDNNFLISVSECDYEIVELFKKNISPNRRILKTKGRYNKKTNYASKPMLTLTVKSPKICETLEKYGMGHNKTFCCNANLSIIPNEYMIDFIRGYFDGDGTVFFTNGTRKYVKKNGEIKYTTYNNFNWSIISKRKEHLITIKNFLENNHNIHSNILNDGRGNFLIEINRKDDFFKMRDILYEDATYFLTRKKEKYYSIVPTKQKLDKKVKKINTQNGETVCTFNTMAEAGKEANITPQGMRVRIRKNLVIDGFKWEYA